MLRQENKISLLRFFGSFLKFGGLKADIAMNICRNNAFVDVLTFIMTTIEHAKQEGRSKTDSMLSFKNKDFVPWT